MTRGNLLQKTDIQRHSRRNVLSLSYNGKVKARVARLHGHDENTFFVVNTNAIPIPDEIEELAQQAGTTLAGSPTEDSFRPRRSRTRRSTSSRSRARRSRGLTRPSSLWSAKPASERSEWTASFAKYAYACARSCPSASPCSTGCRPAPTTHRSRILRLLLRRASLTPLVPQPLRRLSLSRRSSSRRATRRSGRATP